jgi:hypothetical protein
LFIAANLVEPRKPANAWWRCSSLPARISAATGSLGGGSVRTLRHHVLAHHLASVMGAARYLGSQSIIITSAATTAKAPSPALIAQSGLILRGSFACVEESGTGAASFAGALAARFTSCWRAGEYELGRGISLTPSKTVDEATVHEAR